jgi:hypothetical protein
MLCACTYHLVLLQVMLLLEQVYTGQHIIGSRSSYSRNCSSSSDGRPSSSAAADPSGLRQLLLGCAELLRPAANCSVEWRCAALGLMSSAVECFMDSCPGEVQNWLVAAGVPYSFSPTVGVLQWRCAALGLMSSAVECFIDSCPGKQWG